MASLLAARWLQVVTMVCQRVDKLLQPLSSLSYYGILGGCQVVARFAVLSQVVARQSLFVAKLFQVLL